jgi:hypothetical protein
MAKASLTSAILQDALIAAQYPIAWNQRIPMGLPTSWSNDKRKAVSNAITERLDLFRELAPQIDTEIIRNRQMVSIVKGLRKIEKPIGDATAKLKNLGLERQLDEAYVRSAALTRPPLKRRATLGENIAQVRADLAAGKPREPVPLMGYSAAVDLYVHIQVMRDAVSRLARWKKAHAKGKGRRPGSAADLASEISRICKEAGANEREIQEVIDAINAGSSGLPALSLTTLKKRKERRKKRSRAPSDK